MHNIFTFNCSASTSYRLSSKKLIKNCIRTPTSLMKSKFCQTAPSRQSSVYLTEREEMRSHLMTTNKLRSLLDDKIILRNALLFSLYQKNYVVSNQFSENRTCFTTVKTHYIIFE